MNNISRTICELSAEINQEGVDPTKGLPLDLFEFSTTLRPFINVDLLIENDKGEILLSWRDDKHYGTGWQIPGGIIRMMESIEACIQRTAEREIGSRVEFDNDPYAVLENITCEYREGIKNQLERAHNIVLLYKCRVPQDYILDNGDKEKNEEGYLEWFSVLPDNLLKCHKQFVHNEVFKKWMK